MREISDLAVIEPPTVTAYLSGGKVDVTPLVLGELPAMLRAVQPFAAALMAESPDYVGLFAAHGDGVLDMLAIATRSERDAIGLMQIDDGVLLLQAIIEVNRDFFIQRVLPRLKELASAKQVAAGASLSAG
jgi:hypothetical protein